MYLYEQNADWLRRKGLSSEFINRMIKIDFIEDLNVEVRL